LSDWFRRPSIREHVPHRNLERKRAQIAGRQEAFELAFRGYWETASGASREAHSVTPRKLL